MFFSLPTIALASSLLFSTGVLAVAHNGHRRLHAPKRDAVQEGYGGQHRHRLGDCLPPIFELTLELLRKLTSGVKVKLKPKLKSKAEGVVRCRGGGENHYPGQTPYLYIPPWQPPAISPGLSLTSPTGRDRGYSLRRALSPE
ncbi:hypothetical protein VE03_10761, partial [Pseudogymnoascus sp. 23342-1-I1]